MNYITLNGVSSNTITGLLIQELPPISLPKMRTEINEIDGRDGDIVTELGYSAYDKEISIGLHGSFDINQVIAFFASKGTVIFSNEPDRYYRYQVIEQIDFERLVRFRTATVKMHVQPFKYDAEETEIDEDGGDTLTGDIVTFNSVSTDPLADVKVSVTPVQDLHGYANPWPAGGGVNIMPTLTPGTYTSGSLTAVVGADGKITVTGTKTAGSTARIQLANFSDTFAVPVNAYVHYRNSIANSNITFDIGGTAASISSQNRIWQNTSSRTATDSVSLYFGSSVDGTLDFTIQPSVEITGSVTSWTPYSNICPITGWTGANVVRTGKNLLNSAFCVGGKVYGTTTSVNADGSISLTGTAERASRYWSSSDTLALTLPKGTYTLSPNILRLEYSGGSKGGTFTLTEPTTFINAYFSLTQGTTYDEIIYPQLEIGSSATAYEAYSGNTYSFPFGQTVYGGTLDVTSGVLTIDRAYADMGSMNWSAYGNTQSYGGLFYSDDVKASIMHTNNDDIFAISSAYKAVPNKYSGAIGGTFEFQNGCIRVRNGDGRVYLRNDAYLSDDGTALKSAMNGWQLVYLLATPTTVSLTATEIDALLGINNIWSAEGTVEVTVPNILTVTNKGNTIARPRMTIYGSGNVNVIINGIQVFSIAMGDIGYITIDGEQMEATQGEGVLKNRLVTGDYSDFVLQSGENIIALTGNVSEVQISNYSRWL